MRMLDCFASLAMTDVKLIEIAINMNGAYPGFTKY